MPAAAGECALQPLRIPCLHGWSQSRGIRVLPLEHAHALCRQQLQQRLRLLSHDNNIHISRH